MPSGFLMAYLHEVILDLSNWYEDNYDFRRFGPRTEKQRFLSGRALIKDYLHHRGWVSKRELENCIAAAFQLIKEHEDGFQWLYDRLADSESQNTLVKVLAFRALGHHKVKLPLNIPSYWDGLALIEKLADSSDFISIGFRNWRLSHINLAALGLPIRLYDVPWGAYVQFVLEQYRCRRNDGADIAVESGDYVIDAGACWGDTALYFAHRSQPNGKVFSFEFMPENLEVLRRNLALNDVLSRQIQIVERAAWDISDVKLLIEGDGPATRVRAESSDAFIAPLTLTIDDLVQRYNLPKVNFIKMDIEGSELRALKGAKQTIQSYRPKLAISVYHQLSDFYEIPRFLDSLECGFRYYLRHYTIHAEETILFAEAV